jgi:hypothetical protein
VVGGPIFSWRFWPYFRSALTTPTHNRPYVSNDNPFKESEFRTMKYRPNYPGTFGCLEDARDHMVEYVPWCNRNHRHPGIALFSPSKATTARGGRSTASVIALCGPTIRSTRNDSENDRKHPRQPTPSGTIFQRKPTKPSKITPVTSLSLISRETHRNLPHSYGARGTLTFTSGESVILFPCGSGRTVNHLGTSYSSRSGRTRDLSE